MTKPPAYRLQQGNTAATSRLRIRLQPALIPGGLFLGGLMGLPADQTQISQVYPPSPPISKGSDKTPPARLGLVNTTSLEAQQIPQTLGRRSATAGLKPKGNKRQRQMDFTEDEGRSNVCAANISSRINILISSNAVSFCIPLYRSSYQGD